MRTVCVFTGTRAEYGLLRPLLARLQQDPTVSLQIIASGMHMSPEFGLTYREIEKDGFVLDEKIEMLMSSDSSIGISKSIANGIASFSEALDRLAPDIIVILGDRFEALAMAIAATIARIPIAHLHGGEASFGVIDEPIRHSITKMSHLHFTSTEEYRRRVIQLGEAPHTVFNCGALGIENIRTMTLLSRDALAGEINFDLAAPYFMVTFHPVTLEDDSARRQTQELLDALAQCPQRVIFTYANADTRGRIINQLIDGYVAAHPETSIAFRSMGLLRYLSGMQHCAAVIGNSSSGILEAPALGRPTINIGDRQQGRVKPASVLDCAPETPAILDAITRATSEAFLRQLADLRSPYEGDAPSETIATILTTRDLTDILKKRFTDFPIGEFA